MLKKIFLILIMASIVSGCVSLQSQYLLNEATIWYIWPQVQLERHEQVYFPATNAGEPSYSRGPLGPNLEQLYPDYTFNR